MLVAVGATVSSLGADGVVVGVATLRLFVGCDVAGSVSVLVSTGSAVGSTEAIARLTAGAAAQKCCRVADLSASVAELKRNTPIITVNSIRKPAIRLSSNPPAIRSFSFDDVIIIFLLNFFIEAIL